MKTYTIGYYPIDFGSNFEYPIRTYTKYNLTTISLSLKFNN